MSMFDELKCEKKLPLDKELKRLNVKWGQVIFQTKDLDNCLSNYRITKNGLLVEDIVEKEYTYYTLEERKKLKGWNFIKDEKILKEYSKKVEYHGTIKFYELFELNDKEDIWVEFDAYFVYGKLDRIELVKTEKQESRKIRMQKWEKEHKDKISSFSYKFKKYSGCFWLLKMLRVICYSTSKILNKFDAFLIRNMNS